MNLGIFLVVHSVERTDNVTVVKEKAMSQSKTCTSRHEQSRHELAIHDVPQTSTTMMPEEATSTKKKKRERR